MAQIQFLNGSRDGETQALDEEYSLTIGSGALAQIRVADAGVDPEHALIYAVQGQFYIMTHQNSPSGLVVVNSRKIPPGPQGATAVSDRDIILVGRTLVTKFWRGSAPSAGGSSGASSAELARLTKERDDLRAQLSQAQAGGGAAADSLRREKDELAKKLESANRDSDARKRELDSLKEESGAWKRTQGDLEGQLSKLKDEASKKDEELERERKRAEDALADAARAKPDLEKKDAELEALRKTVDELRSAENQAKRDRRPALREGSDLAKALQALSVPDALRDRIAAAVKDETDRELLSREGPVVPLRGLRCPACSSDLEAELGALKERRKHRAALRALGIEKLSNDEAIALLARAKA